MSKHGRSLRPDDIGELVLTINTGETVEIGEARLRLSVLGAGKIEMYCVAPRRVVVNRSKQPLPPKPVRRAS